MLDRPDLEDNRSEGVEIGECEWCKDEIMEWEEYYDFQDVLIHDDCILNYLREFRK